MSHTFMRQRHTHTRIQYMQMLTNSQTCLFDKFSKWFISLKVSQDLGEFVSKQRCPFSEDDTEMGPQLLEIRDICQRT